MAIVTEPRKLLSGAATARRLDVSYGRLLKAVEAGVLVPAALLDGKPLFAEDDVTAIASDCIQRSQVRGATGTR